MLLILSAAAGLAGFMACLLLLASDGTLDDQDAGASGDGYVDGD